MNKWFLYCIGIIVIMFGVLFTVYYLDLTDKKIGTEAFEFIKDYIVPAGSNITLNDVASESGMIRLNVTLDQITYQSFVSKDGKWIFVQGIEKEDYLQRLKEWQQQNNITR